MGHWETVTELTSTTKSILTEHIYNIQNEGKAYSPFHSIQIQMKSQVLHGMDLDVVYGENDMRLLTLQPNRSCQTCEYSHVSIDFDNSTFYNQLALGALLQ